jgi:hypothetical protein
MPGDTESETERADRPGDGAEVKAPGASPGPVDARVLSAHDPYGRLMRRQTAS